MIGMTGVYKVTKDPELKSISNDYKNLCSNERIIRRESSNISVTWTECTKVDSSNSESLSNSSSSSNGSSTFDESSSLFLEKCDNCHRNIDSILKIG